MKSKSELLRVAFADSETVVVGSAAPIVPADIKSHRSSTGFSIGPVPKLIDVPTVVGDPFGVDTPALDKSPTPVAEIVPADNDVALAASASPNAGKAFEKYIDPFPFTPAKIVARMTFQVNENGMSARPPHRLPRRATRSCGPPQA
ncbi:hypothetical protein [Rhodovulum marinum]|uniref:hypothetical protein n=1 Tax=Rhodovulum marinum TaxID=320662 RepID=UPI001404B78B|nr:hypothetical protein [Rhodovulum marinum]